MGALEGEEVEFVQQYLAYLDYLIEAHAEVGVVAFHAEIALDQLLQIVYLIVFDDAWRALRARLLDWLVVRVYLLADYLHIRMVHKGVFHQLVTLVLLVRTLTDLDAADAFLEDA